MIVKDERLYKLMDSIANAMKVFIDGNTNPSLVLGIEEAISSVTGELYSGLKTDTTIELIDLIHDPWDAGMEAVRNKYLLWNEEIRADLKELMSTMCRIDRDFYNLLKICDRCSEKTILDGLLGKLDDLKSTNEEVYVVLIQFYRKYTHLWGMIDPQNGIYEHFTDRISAVKDHIWDIQWLYERLGDYRSKKVLYGIVRFWIFLEFDVLTSIKENNYDDYFDMDLLKDKITEEEVFVDCGSYTGDTIESYLSNYYVYKKMFLYDMVPKNLECARQRLMGVDNLFFRNFGVGSKVQAGKLIKVKNKESSEEAVGEDSSTEADDTIETVNIPLIALDDDIKERITFIKMDIEGAELDALKGCEHHITEDKPKLAICTYHHYSDLWDIPKLIESYREDYRFYMRYQGNNVMPMEFYLMAV